jgi:hypothetical protein
MNNIELSSKESGFIDFYGTVIPKWSLFRVKVSPPLSFPELKTPAFKGTMSLFDGKLLLFTHLSLGVRILQLIQLN